MSEVQICEYRYCRRPATHIVVWRYGKEEMLLAGCDKHWRAWAEESGALRAYAILDDVELAN